MDKERLLQHLTENWYRLTQAIEGVPHEQLEQFHLAAQPSIKAICACITAWDGEAMRRIDFITGQTFAPPHDFQDEAYWEMWLKKQLEIKSVMPVQGILTDMIGTRQRLLNRINELNEFYVDRWLEEDPQAAQPYFANYLHQAQVWRQAWDAANPPETGVEKVWRSLRDRLASKKSG